MTTPHFPRRDWKPKSNPFGPCVRKQGIRLGQVTDPETMTTVTTCLVTVEYEGEPPIRKPFVMRYENTDAYDVITPISIAQTNSMQATYLIVTTSRGDPGGDPPPPP